MMDVGAINSTEEKSVTETTANKNCTMAEKCKIETSPEAEFNKKGNWSELPSLPLEKIYSFLNRLDRVKMSLVCRKWSEGYSSSSLWKIFRFDLKESVIRKDSCPRMKFVRKYGSMFQHVDINYNILLPYQKDLIYIWCTHFIEFLQLLTSNSQLMSVKIHGLLWCFAHIDATTQDNVKRAICYFLGSQHHLKRVEFHYCFFDFPEYVKLLNELPEYTRNSITHFGLCGLTYCDFKEENQDSTVEYNLLTFITGLPSLITLTVDYSMIFENTFSRHSVVMETLKKCQMWVNLSKIILCYESGTVFDDFRGLTSTDWQCLKTLYPNLQVELNFSTSSPSREEVELVILPDIPITRLDYASEESDLVPNSSPMEIDVLFAHLLKCKTTDRLASLCVKWDVPVPDLASTFIPILQACKKLKSLDLLIVYPVNGIDLLVDSWLENRPESLKKVYIEISGVKNDDNYTILKNLTAEYESGLELVGLNVKVCYILEGCNLICTCQHNF